VLKLTVPGVELFDENTNRFITKPATSLLLEHSLVSLSKWESTWEVAFLALAEKTTEQTIDYIRCMTLTEDVDPEVYSQLSNENFQQVNTYIDAKMTATTFAADQSKPGGREIITSELIYYWMIALNIPFECQHWHLKRLITLIRVCNVKNAPQKKMSRSEILARNRELNAQRKAKYNTKG